MMVPPARTDTSILHVNFKNVTSSEYKYSTTVNIHCTSVRTSVNSTGFSIGSNQPDGNYRIHRFVIETSICLAFFLELSKSTD